MKNEEFKRGTVEGMLLALSKQKPDKGGGVRVERDGIIEVLESVQEAFKELRVIKKALGPERLGRLYDEMQSPPHPNWLDNR